MGALMASPASTDVTWALLLPYLLGSGIVSAVVTAVLGSFTTASKAATEARRRGYVEALEAILAWSEFPYRVRRRASDDPERLEALAALGHQVQERRTGALAWVAADNREMYEVFRLNLEALDAVTGPSIADAWQQSPVTAASGMVLNGWGPGRMAGEVLRRLNCAVTYRFGWRRRVLFTPALLRARLRRYRPTA
ncbi:MAG: hypothetical protein JNL54_08780 [Kineosporiaceae bacterium]|nr:hypothetical protein [Kineosporiaceae bacterium]